MRAVYTRRRFLVAGAVTAIPLGGWWAFASSRGPTGEALPPSSTPLAPADLTGDIAQGVPSSTTTSTTAPTPTSIPPLDRDLIEGAGGPEISLLQQRLTDLGFDPGPVDGQFGTLTRQAVWAFEKLVMGTQRSQATGRVTPQMWDLVHDSISIQPRRPTGGLADHVEIYLPEQVMLVFHADRPALVAHVSTGELREDATRFVPWYENAAEYRETITIDTDNNGDPLPEPEQRAVIGWSYTPPGVFEADRRIEGLRNGPLGSMWDPIYINQGIAIHGALNVPLEPVSHGCIRVSRYLGATLQSRIDLGDRVLIWDGATEPEQQPAEVQKMRWDQPDPDATTTTTTSTTTTTTTSTTSTTTVPPTTTVEPGTASTAPTSAPGPTTTAHTGAGD